MDKGLWKWISYRALESVITVWRILITLRQDTEVRTYWSQENLDKC